MLVLTSLNSQYVHSNLAIRYLAGIARRHKLTHEIVEFTINDSLDHILRTLYWIKPAVAAFSCYIWNIEDSLTIIQDLKKVLPSVFIIVGGPEVSFDPASVMEKNPAIDVIISGEGEETFDEVLTLGLLEQSWEKILGLTWRKNGTIVSNPPRQQIADLNWVPRPYDADFIPDGRIVYYETSRGCPFSCSYCISSASHGVRYFPFERVKKELEDLTASGVGQVKFVDRTFNCNPKRALELMKYLSALKGETNYHFEIVADMLDEETLEFLGTVRKGLFQFEIGVQSTNSCTLARINRRQDLGRLAYNFERLQKSAVIRTHLDLIVGLPEEDLHSLEKSFNWTYNLHPDYLQLGFLKLLKGTSARRNAKEDGYRFKERPPYEVLSNRWIAFDEICWLKVFEDLLQKFRNSKSFGYSVDYAVSTIFEDNAFKCFREMALYWIQNGLTAKPVKRERLYCLLHRFLANIKPGKTDEIRQLVILDFVLNNPNHAIPEELGRMKIENQGRKIKDYLRENLPHFSGTGTSAKPRIEVFPIDILALAGISEPVQEKTFYTVLFDYGKDQCVPRYVEM